MILSKVALELEQDKGAVALKSPCDFDRILCKTAWGVESERRALDSETSSLFSGTSLVADTAVDAILSKVALELEQDKKAFALKSPCDFDVTYDASYSAIDVSD